LSASVFLSFVVSWNVYLTQSALEIQIRQAKVEYVIKDQETLRTSVDDLRKEVASVREILARLDAKLPQ